MRNIIALVSVVLLTICAPAVAGEMCRGVPMPPTSKQQPVTAYVDRYFLDPDAVVDFCGYPPGYHTVAACVHFSPTPKHPDRFVVIISNSLSDTDRACVLRYENAHMPPNNWADPKVEGRH